MRRFALFLLCLLPSCAAAGASVSLENNCVAAGTWVEPAAKKTLAHDELITNLAKRRAVLLGETHTSRQHHRWQLHVIAGLYAINPNLVLAFEAFPRRFQPQLDRWVNDEFSEEEFLKEVDWAKTWRFDSSLYMELFNFARINRIPMLAMNIDRELVSRIGKGGFESIPEESREGVSAPAPATDDYLSFLSSVFGHHGPGNKDKDAEAEQKERIKEPPVLELRQNPAFMLFVQSQIAWDRAMAQKIAEARAIPPKGMPLVVGVVGQGHIQYGFGIPHQLADLGVHDAAVLLPWDFGQDCEDLNPVNGHELATAVFGLPRTGSAKEDEEKPKLGVYIENAEGGGARIVRIVENSIAAGSGLENEDVITEAAGKRIQKIEELMGAVSGTAPGLWLPLTVRRGDSIMEIIAKFPPRQ